MWWVKARILIVWASFSLFFPLCAQSYVVENLEPHMREPSLFTYSVDCTVDSFQDTADGDAPTSVAQTIEVKDRDNMCSDILTSQFLSNTLEFQVDKGNKYVIEKTNTLKTLVPAQPAMKIFETSRNPSLCCKQRGTEACPWCYGDEETCLVRLYNREDTRKRIFLKAFCKMCPQINCEKTCPNGKYASDFVKPNPISGLVEAVPDCVDCDPGTFLTCVDMAACVWKVPIRGSVLVGEEIQTIKPLPSKCFPCAQALNYWYHYILSTDPKMNTTINPDLAVYCEGRVAPPRNCPDDSYTNNPGYTKCVCRDKYYHVDGRGCVPCPKGSFCLGGEIRPCPVHTYQDAQGQTSCKRCSSDGTAQGIFNMCPDRHQREWCGEGTAEPRCVPCSRCRRRYVPLDDGQVECYRSS